MAALLVALAVMAVLMSVAMPVWRHDAQREKEEELVWRGQQYIRAIRLFQTKNRTFPTSVDMLVQGRFLRKKYKDPITDEDFLPIPAAGAIPGQGGRTVGGAAGAGGRGGPVAGGRTGTPSMGGLGSGSSGIGSSSAFSSTSVPGGLLGVVSKSKDESIRLYQGRNHYNEWTFIFVNQQPGGPGGQGRGGRGRAAGPGVGSPFGPGGVGSPFGSPTFGSPTFGSSPFGGSTFGGPGTGRGRGTGTFPGGAGPGGTGPGGTGPGGTGRGGSGRGGTGRGGGRGSS
jgi:type II secretory pathway pseudopilin PulG